jgi:hypothetical protein
MMDAPAVECSNTPPWQRVCAGRFDLMSFVSMDRLDTVISKEWR